MKPPIKNPFLSARRAGVPIVGIETADPAASIAKCCASLNGKGESVPLIQWDLLRGPRALNKTAARVLSDHFTEDLEAMKEPTVCLSTLLAKVDKLVVTEEDNADKQHAAIIFMIHANRWIEDYAGTQAIWNCRDGFEPKGIMLVLVGPSIKLPRELSNDVVIISEPLPDHEELDDILTKIAKDASLKPEAITERENVVDTMTGTSAFGARQILAMSITREGVDRDTLWLRQKKMIEQTKGLSVWRGGETFADLGGLKAIKDYGTRVLTSGKTPVNAILWADEIEKQLAGAQGDLSGTSQDQLGALLRFFQDYNIAVMLLLGHPGTGKSAIAKAMGSVAGRPVLGLDLGAAKGSLVGQSEQQIRAALEIAVAVSGGKLIGVLTCNKLASLPPEFRRRCTLGTWFFGLPDDDERAAIWPHWIKVYELDKRQGLPNDQGWTGAEIRACCDVAYRTGLTLKEAAKYIVPIIKSAPEQIADLCRLANNRFLSASTPGVYRYDETTATAATSGRKMEL